MGIGILYIAAATRQFFLNLAIRQPYYGRQINNNIHATNATWMLNIYYFFASSM